MGRIWIHFLNVRILSEETSLRNQNRSDRLVVVSASGKGKNWHFINGYFADFALYLFILSAKYAHVHAVDFALSWNVLTYNFNLSQKPGKD